MEFEIMKKVVIITELTIKKNLLDIIRSHGAKGYTIDTVGGSGDTGVKGGENSFLGDYLMNIKVEIITTKEIAEGIMCDVVKHLLDKYAGIAYMFDVDVIRGKRF